VICWSRTRAEKFHEHPESFCRHRRDVQPDAWPNHGLTLLVSSTSADLPRGGAHACNGGRSQSAKERSRKPFPGLYCHLQSTPAYMQQSGGTPGDTTKAFNRHDRHNPTSKLLPSCHPSICRFPLLLHKLKLCSFQAPPNCKGITSTRSRGFRQSSRPVLNSSKIQGFINAPLPVITARQLLSSSRFLACKTSNTSKGLRPSKHAGCLS
jgi:hypothetical protein